MDNKLHCLVLDDIVVVELNPAFSHLTAAIAIASLLVLYSGLPDDIGLHMNGEVYSISVFRCVVCMEIISDIQSSTLEGDHFHFQTPVQNENSSVNGPSSP